MKSTPRNQTTATYERLTMAEREFLRQTALEIGDLPEANQELQKRFYEKFGKPVNRFVAHYWRRTAFGRRQARYVKTGVSYVMTPQQAEFAYSMIETGQYKTVADVVSAAFDALAKEGELIS